MCIERGCLFSPIIRNIFFFSSPILFLPFLGWNQIISSTNFFFSRASSFKLTSSSILFKTSSSSFCLLLAVNPCLLELLFLLFTKRLFFHFFQNHLTHQNPLVIFLHLYWATSFKLWFISFICLLFTSKHEQERTPFPPSVFNFVKRKKDLPQLHLDRGSFKKISTEIPSNLDRKFHQVLINQTESFSHSFFSLF